MLQNLQSARGRDGTGQDFLDPTGKFQNHRRLTGRLTGFRPARWTGFFTEGFFSLINVFDEKFSKGGMGEVLKFVTLDGGLRNKNAKYFLRFLQK